MNAGRHALPIRLPGCSILSMLLVGFILTALAVANDVASKFDEDASDDNADVMEDEQVADDFDDVADPREFDDLVCAGDWESAAAAAKERLESLLEEQAERVRWISEMNDPQRERLLLAGRGDIKRLLERAEDWKHRRQRLRDAGNPLLQLNEILREAEPLRKQFTTGPFDENSYFAKILKRSVTSGQLADYAALRDIEQIGGRLVTRVIGAHAVKGLRLGAANLTDENRPLLRKLDHLGFLVLDDPEVTDDDLVILEDMTALEHLDLANSAVTDDGLVHLRGLRWLKSLRLDNTCVTGEGFAGLTDLASLEFLSAAVSSVSDKGLVHLESFVALRAVDLQGALVTDEGMAHLHRLTGLERVKLDDTPVTDAGLNQLKTLKDLEFLSCRQTEVTFAGIARLRRWRPRLTIEH